MNNITPRINWKTGYEIELLASVGKTRRDLALALATLVKGRVSRRFYPQSELREVKDKPVFESLTLGFDVTDKKGELIARCVDDLTISQDLDINAAPKAGWYRIVSDDRRFISLAEIHCNPAHPIDTVLSPLASLFDTPLHANEHGMFKVLNKLGDAIAVVAQLPGERERPCELITAPLTKNHYKTLSIFLRQARKLGFLIPKEAAIHIHFDATRLSTPSTITAIVYVFGTYRLALREMFATNPRCIRLGDWSAALYELVMTPTFANLSWTEAKKQLLETKPTKYCDFNLLNIILGTPSKHTFEVRILPGMLNAKPIIKATLIIEKMLTWCVNTTIPLPRLPNDLSTFLERIRY